MPIFSSRTPSWGPSRGPCRCLSWGLSGPFILFMLLETHMSGLCKLQGPSGRVLPTTRLLERPCFEAQWTRSVSLDLHFCPRKLQGPSGIVRFMTRLPELPCFEAVHFWAHFGAHLGAHLGSPSREPISGAHFGGPSRGPIWAAHLGGSPMAQPGGPSR